MICQEHGVKKKKISDGSINFLKKHDWPGNIRELRNVIERLVILSDHEIKTSDIKIEQ